MSFNHDLQPGTRRPSHVIDTDRLVVEMIDGDSGRTNDLRISLRAHAVKLLKLMWIVSHVNAPLVNDRADAQECVDHCGSDVAINAAEFFLLPNGRPSALFYVDERTHMANKVITFGGRGQLLGEHMDFDPRDPDQGIFLIDVESGVELKADPAGLIEPASIAIILPMELIVGRTYTLEVRVRCEDCGELHVGRLAQRLTAQFPTW